MRVLPDLGFHLTEPCLRPRLEAAFGSETKFLHRLSSAEPVDDRAGMHVSHGHSDHSRFPNLTFGGDYDFHLTTDPPCYL